MFDLVARSEGLLEGTEHDAYGIPYETFRWRFDRLAEVTHDPDHHFDDLRRLYMTDAGLTVPPTVFNAVMNRMDAL